MPEVVGVPTIELIVPSPEFIIAAVEDSPASVLNFQLGLQRPDLRNYLYFLDHNTLRRTSIRRLNLNT